MSCLSVSVWPVGGRTRPSNETLDRCLEKKTSAKSGFYQPLVSVPHFPPQPVSHRDFSLRPQSAPHTVVEMFFIEPEQAKR